MTKGTTMSTTFHYGETTLDASQIAEIVGMTTERIEGIFGPGDIATVTVQGDDNPMRPDEWDLGDEAWAVIHLSDEYVFTDQIGDNVPSALVDVIGDQLGRSRYRYNGTDWAMRVVSKYAALHGYRVDLVHLTGYNESAEMLVLVPTTTDRADDIVVSIQNEWQTYFGQEVYGVTVEMASPLVDGDDLDESLWGLYGDDAVQDYADEMIGYGVRSIMAEIAEVRAA